MSGDASATNDGSEEFEDETVKVDLCLGGGNTRNFCSVSLIASFGAQ